MTSSFPFSCLAAACALYCRDLAVAAVKVPAVLCCEAMLWAAAFLTYPLLLLAAVDRERKLDRLVGEMQEQMERVVWENGELEEKLRAALMEHAAMEEILDEMEEEHDHAFATIDLLETQLKALKKENARLKEHKGKSMWDTAADDRDGGKKADGGKSAPRAWEATAGEDLDKEGGEGVVIGSGDPATPSTVLTAKQMDVARVMQATARRRSLFSLGMSVAVGGIAWSADAPCLPLLAGLLTVVCMSMCSVARLFRPGGGGARGSDREGAVALLSLNWFLLGVLTYPMVPGVARALLPRAGRLAGPALTWLAAAVPL